MTVLASPIAEGNSYTNAVFGFAGVLIGAIIAGGISIWVAKQTREAAERAWIRDNRREIYDKFLTCAQTLLIVCEEAQESKTKEAKVSVETAFTKFFEVYGVVQTVADKALVDASRRYGYRLWELKSMLDSPPTSVTDPENFNTVTPLIRADRQDTIDAMRAELGLTGSVRLKGKYNPFVETPLEKEYAESPRPRPGAKGVVLRVHSMVGVADACDGPQGGQTRSPRAGQSEPRKVGCAPYPGLHHE